MEEVSSCCYAATKMPTYNFCPICGKPLPEHPQPVLYRLSRYSNGRLLGVQYFSGTLGALLERCRFSVYEYTIEIITVRDLVTLLPDNSFTESEAEFGFQGVTPLVPRLIAKYITEQLPGYVATPTGVTSFKIRRDFSAT